MVLELVISWRSRPPWRLEPRAIAHQRVPPAESPLITHNYAAFCNFLRRHSDNGRNGAAQRTQRSLVYERYQLKSDSTSSTNNGVD